MSDERIVVIGAGIGGLVSAALLARARVRRDRGRGGGDAGRQATRGDRRRLGDRRRARPCSRCATCSRIFSTHAATRSASIWRMRPATIAGAPCMGPGGGSTFSPIRARAKRRSAISPERARRAAIARFAPRRSASSTRSTGRSCATPTPIRSRWAGGWARRASPTTAICALTRRCGARWADISTTRGSQQLFGRYATYCGSSPFACPATLMLIAHVEASGVWLIEGGMHRLAEALEALGQRQRRAFSLWRGGARDPDRGWSRRRRGAGERRADRGGRGDLQRRSRRALAPGAFGRAAQRAVPRVPRSAPLARRRWCGPGMRPRAAFRCRATMSFSRDDYPRRVRRARRGPTGRRAQRLRLRPGSRRVTARHRAQANASRSSSTPRRSATAQDSLERRYEHAPGICWTAFRGRGFRWTWRPRRS